MNKEQFDSITKWQDETFKSATPLTKIAHLADELSELVNDLKTNSFENQKLEFADCFILLFGAAASNGMTYDDICSYIDIKMTINYVRQWSPPDDLGICKHIKNDSEA